MGRKQNMLSKFYLQEHYWYDICKVIINYFEIASGASSVFVIFVLIF